MGSGRKKRKAAVLAPPAGSEEREQEPPPGDDERDQERPLGEEDRISYLPEDILGDIISRLPVREGARTRVLGKLWRNLWHSAPLNLDISDLVKDDVSYVDGKVLSYVLSKHHGPAIRFSLRMNYFSIRPRVAMVDHWLRSPSLNNLQDLDLRFDYRADGLHPLPASAFRFSETLRVVNLTTCRLPSGVFLYPEPPKFSHLRKLTLLYVSISDSSFHSLIAACPVLDSILLTLVLGLPSIRIKSASIKNIGMRVGLRTSHDEVIHAKELIIEDSAVLTKLLILDPYCGMSVRIVSAPKLDTIGFLDDGHMLYHDEDQSKFIFNSTTIQGLMVQNLANGLESIKCLAIDMGPLQLNAVIEMLKCFPFLEKIYIQSISGGQGNRWRLKHKNITAHLDINLKMVVMGCYRGTKAQVNFCNFFLHKAAKLEMLKLQVDDKDYCEDFVTKHLKLIEFEDRVSPTARIEFTKEKCQRAASEFKLASDLDKEDPFKA